MRDQKNLLKVWLDRKLTEEIKEALQRKDIPKYHCIRELLAACVEIYEKAEANFIKEGKDLSAYGGGGAGIPITPLQKEFLLSPEAEDIFCTKEMQDFLGYLRKYSIPKLHI